MLRVLLQESSIHKLGIRKHIFFCTLAGAFSKSPVVYQNNIIVVAVKILCIFCPTFYTSRVTMKIKNKTLGIVTKKMQAIYPDIGLGFKKQFFKRSVVLELKICLEFFRFKNEFLLHEINDHRKNEYAENNI